ncbi:GroES-like protein [Cyathus striatus]|nr:GroES-like protein [Cyathus striatus]
MKAIQIAGSGGLDQLVAAEVPLPELGPTDILVNIKAVTINPVEAKIRSGKWAGGQLPAGSILGFDCAGVVSSLGTQVPAGSFTPGEEVWLLGSTIPTRSNAEYVTVDYRVVAPKPKSLSFEDAAAVPLVGLTAWEMFDQIGVGKEPGALLVINGAGGVGSVSIQLAKARGVKTIIATASREVSIKHVKALGATHTINHHEPLKPQVEALNLAEPIKYVLVLTNLTKSVLDQAIDVVAPWGHISLAEQGPQGTYDGFGAGQTKGVAVHWGFVFTRIICKWEMEYQGKALRDMAKMFDEGKLKSITSRTLELTVQGVRDAHQLMESGEAIGKVVLKVPETGAFQ